MSPLCRRRQQKWHNGVSTPANTSIHWLANELLALAAHFNQALTLWRAFGLCVINSVITFFASCFRVRFCHICNSLWKSHRRRGSWKMLSLWVRANCQPAIWDSATHVEISEPHDKYIEVSVLHWSILMEVCDFWEHSLNVSAVQTRRRLRSSPLSFSVFALAG